MVDLDADAFKLKRMMKQDAHERAFEIMLEGQRQGEADTERLFQSKLAEAEFRHDQKVEKMRREHRQGAAQASNKIRLNQMKRRNECV